MNVASSNLWIKQQEKSNRSKKWDEPWQCFVFSKMFSPFCLVELINNSRMTLLQCVYLHPTWSSMKELLGIISSFPAEIFSIVNYIIIPARIMLCPISSYYLKHARLSQVQQGLFKVQQGLFKVHIGFYLILHHQMSGLSVFSILHNMWYSIQFLFFFVLF